MRIWKLSLISLCSEKTCWQTWGKRRSVKFLSKSKLSLGFRRWKNARWSQSPSMFVFFHWHETLRYFCLEGEELHACEKELSGRSSWEDKYIDMLGMLASLIWLILTSWTVLQSTVFLKWPIILIPNTVGDNQVESQLFPRMSENQSRRQSLQLRSTCPWIGKIFHDITLWRGALSERKFILHSDPILTNFGMRCV